MVRSSSACDVGPAASIDDVICGGWPARSAQARTLLDHGKGDAQCTRRATTAGAHACRGCRQKSWMPCACGFCTCRYGTSCKRSPFKDIAVRRAPGVELQRLVLQGGRRRLGRQNYLGWPDELGVHGNCVDRRAECLDPMDGFAMVSVNRDAPVIRWTGSSAIVPLAPLAGAANRRPDCAACGPSHCAAPSTVCATGRRRPRTRRRPACVRQSGSCMDPLNGRVSECWRTSAGALLPRRRGDRSAVFLATRHVIFRAKRDFSSFVAAADERGRRRRRRVVRPATAAAFAARADPRHQRPHARHHAGPTRNGAGTAGDATASQPARLVHRVHVAAFGRGSSAPPAKQLAAAGCRAVAQRGRALSGAPWPSLIKATRGQRRA